ncbi:conserved hypothetical protein [Vibrio phage 501E54-1]|nr:conserved hypothetical protein [Vibrio phage 501E54-1]
MTNTYDIEINKEMVLSTCHVTDNEINGGVQTSADEYSNRYLVNSVIEDLKESTVESDYPNLIKLLQIAKAHNCRWLVLDCDGGVVEGLPTFDW